MLKKALSLLLALSMAMSCAAVAFAEEDGLTINTCGPEVEETAEPQILSDELATGETAESAVSTYNSGYEDVTFDVEADYDNYVDEALQAEVEAALAQPAMQDESLSTYNVDESINTYDADYSQYGNSIEGYVTRLYEVALRRSPDAKGFNEKVSDLRSGTKSGAQVLYDILGSPEYVSKNYSNEQIVTDAYNAILGRAPDSSGYSFWLSGLQAGMNYVGILKGFSESDEFRKMCASFGVSAGSLREDQLEWRNKNRNITVFVSHFYTQCLGRTAELAGLNNWTQALLCNTRTGAQMASEFFFSSEYTSKHTSNADYAVMLYRTLLSREGDTAGLIHYAEMLNYKHSRAYLVNDIMISNEFNKLCSDAGIPRGSKINTPEDNNEVEWASMTTILSLINGARGARGLNYLAMRDDLYSVATLRAPEIVTRYNNNRTVDGIRPNGNSYKTAYSDKGLGSAPEQYESQVRDASNASMQALATELVKSSSKAYAMLFSNTVSSFALGKKTDNNVSYYAIEVARL